MAPMPNRLAKVLQLASCLHVPLGGSVEQASAICMHVLVLMLLILLAEACTQLIAGVFIDVYCDMHVS